MNTHDAVLRTVRRETENRRDYLDIFREFLNHLDRASRRRRPEAAKEKRRRAGKR